MLVENVSRNKCFFQVRVSHVLHFIFMTYSLTPPCRCFVNMYIHEVQLRIWWSLSWKQRDIWRKYMVHITQNYSSYEAWIGSSDGPERLDILWICLTNWYSLQDMYIFVGCEGLMSLTMNSKTMYFKESPTFRRNILLKVKLRKKPRVGSSPLHYMAVLLVYVFVQSIFVSV
jgi:hypothetical protein